MGTVVLDMDRFVVRIADKVIEIQSRFPFLQEFCRDYVVDNQEAEFAVMVSDEEFVERKRCSPAMSEDYLEGLCIYRKIAEQLPYHNRFVFHGASITFEQDGYLFTAPSGTGKSTHISGWKKYLKGAVDIVNGDKPVISVEHMGDKVSVKVHGSPWAGKECWQKNRSASLNGICFVRQGKENRIQRLEAGQCLDMLMNQVYLPQDGGAVGLTLELLDKMITNVPAYLLECDISEEAVKCSFEAMTGLNYNEYV